MFGEGMFGGGGRAMFDPSVSTEDMDKYGKLLSLSKAQQTAAKSLHDAYVQDYNAAAEKVRDEIDAIREDAREDPSRFQEMGDVMAKFRTKRAEILRGFLARPSIYSTAHFQALLEPQARANLQRALA